MKGSFVPYSESEPYLFLSYAHSDWKIVYFFLQLLNQAGCRVWYDEGIPLAGDWRDAVAEKVSKCQAVVALLSNNSANSKHCKAELEYAEKNNKPILLVHLEDGVQLSPGLQMYLGGKQAIKLSDFSLELIVQRLSQEQERTFSCCFKKREENSARTISLNAANPSPKVVASPSESSLDLHDSSLVSGVSQSPAINIHSNEIHINGKNCTSSEEEKRIL